MCYFCNLLVFISREMAKVTEKTIDIDDILKGKLGAKAKFVPTFLVNWLKRIAHQDQVNAFLWESREKIGVEWSVLGDVHYSRALKDYPYLDDLGIDTLVSPPNRADLQNTSDEGDWKALAMEHEQQTTYNKFPFATTPHWVQYVDPETGEVSRIAGIPVEQAGS